MLNGGADRHSASLRRRYIFVAALWSALVIGSLVWDIHHERETTLRSATAAARANINKDISFRKWAAAHGGVYVPPTGHTPPNPYLKVPDRDVVTTTGKALTLMNPAYALREMQTDFADDFGTISRITSLKPVNPKNAPDEWEATALREFEQGAKERLEMQQMNGQPYLRLMLPFAVEESCIKCHEHQGYKVGDIRGGISSAISMRHHLAHEHEIVGNMVLSHGAIWLIGLGGLGFSYRRDRHQATERERAADKLRASEHSLSEAQRIAHLGSWNLDIARDELAWSDEIYRIFEIDPERFGATYEAFLNTIHPDDRDFVNRAYSESLASKTPYNIVHRLLMKDGRVKYVNEICETVYGADGAPLRSFGIVHDITAQKQAEEELIRYRDHLEEMVGQRIAELKAANEKLAVTQFAMDRAGIGIHWIDAETGRFHYVNEHAAYMLGYTVEEMLAMRVSDIDPAFPQDTFAERAASLREIGSATIQTTGKHKDGRIIPIEVTFYFQKEAGRVISFVTDITERKRSEAELIRARDEAESSERALRESEAAVRKKLAALLEPEGDLGELELSDILDVQELQSLMDAFYRLTHMICGIVDLNGKVLVASGWQDICTQFHRCHAETLKNCVESDTILSGGTNPGSYKQYHCKNNMWDMSTPIIIGDKHVGNMFFGQFFFEDEPPDVELFRQQAVRYGFDEKAYLGALARVPRWSREQVDALMMFYSKLAAAVSRLSYSTVKLAHALAGRDRAVKALTQAKEAAEAANKDMESFSYSISHDLRTPLRAINGFSNILQEDYAARLDDEGMRLLRVVSDNALKMGGLIDDILAFSRAGRNEIVRSTIDMNSMVTGVWEELKPERAGRDVRLDILDLPPAQGDAAMIRQVLINLLSNAIKFTGQRADARVEVGGHAQAGETVYHVKDNGAGFNMEYAPKLFGVFHRLHGADEFEGTGIGLAIVKRIVTKHGGRVWAEGKPGEGATVWFALPDRGGSHG